MSATSDRNKKLLRERREASQLHSLPSALPGEGELFKHQEQMNPLVGFTPDSVIVNVDSPLSPTDSPEDFITRASGFPSQALGPTVLSYGPMLAEGDIVFEEWESLMYGGNGNLYNNQYCWILRFAGDQLIDMREYNDSHHAWMTFGKLGQWPDLAPPTAPRRRSRHGSRPVPVLAESELETVFDVVDEFDLDPRLLRDVEPSGAAAPSHAGAGVEGNKALVRALRHARAAGDINAVNELHAEGFRHFIAGERPFGWDHLPLQQIYAPLVEHLAGPLKLRYGPPIAEGDRVFEEMDSFARLDDGTVYNNWHCIVHEIREGKIVQTREYMDTRHMWVVLGRWASWAATPVTPRATPRRSNLQGIAATIQYPTMFRDLERWRPFEPVAR